MQNKNIIISVVVCVAIAGISFWGGMTYARKNITAANASRQGNFSQGGFNQNGGARGQGMRGGAGGGLVAGQILSKDATSMTIKLRDGGSKIVLLSPASKVEKTISGTITDVVVGNQVAVTGTANPDGSVNATSIQIRPTLPIQVPVPTN
jgi:hypothetical protein